MTKISSSPDYAKCLIWTLDGLFHAVNTWISWMCFHVAFSSEKFFTTLISKDTRDIFVRFWWWHLDEISVWWFWFWSQSLKRENIRWWWTSIFLWVFCELTPQWQSSERNLPVTIVQKLDIFYSGILNLEFLNFFYNF